MGSLVQTTIDKTKLRLVTGDIADQHTDAVLTAAGPVWLGGDADEPKVLASAYRRRLELAVQNGLHSISFPSISTGAFGYPIPLAAPVALRAIVDFLKQETHDLDAVRMVVHA